MHFIEKILELVIWVCALFFDDNHNGIIVRFEHFV